MFIPGLVARDNYDLLKAPIRKWQKLLRHLFMISEKVDTYNGSGGRGNVRSVCSIHQPRSPSGVEPAHAHGYVTCKPPRGPGSK